MRLLPAVAAFALAALLVVALIQSRGPGRAGPRVRPPLKVTGGVRYLYPGARRRLSLVVWNNRGFRIRVVSLTVRVRNAKHGCGRRYLKVARFHRVAARGPARISHHRAPGDDAAERARCLQARGLPAQVHGERSQGMKAACVLFAAAGALLLPGHGDAAWSVGRSGTGAIGSKTMPAAAPAAPTGSVSSHDVTVSWSASKFADGTNVPSYIVKRYDAITNALQTTLSACSGNVGATSCVEHGVPTGSWKYTVTPAAGVWRGTESAKSATVIVLI